SYMWRDLLPALAADGWRCVAPDLPGFGATPVDRPATWERMVDAVEAFRQDAGLARVVLVVHDWGGLIGLRWACEHPGAVRALVISNTGFFADGKWHGLARMLRTPGMGEELVGGMTRAAFGVGMREQSPRMDERALDEYFKAFADEPRRRGQLELYRSAEFAELAAYRGRLASLGVPVLLLWGPEDRYVPVAAARRFMRELP